MFVTNAFYLPKTNNLIVQTRFYILVYCLDVRNIRIWSLFQIKQVNPCCFWIHKTNQKTYIYLYKPIYHSFFPDPTLLLKISVYLTKSTWFFFGGGRSLLNPFLGPIGHLIYTMSLWLQKTYLCLNPYISGPPIFWSPHCK